MRQPRFPSGSTSGHLRCALTANLTTLPTTARPTGTMGLTGLRGESSLEPVHGSTDLAASMAMWTTATILTTATTDRCLSVGHGRFITSRVTRRGTDADISAMQATMRTGNMRCLDIGAAAAAIHIARAGSADPFLLTA